jgi:hypothetical protein
MLMFGFELPASGGGGEATALAANASAAVPHAATAATCRGQVRLFMSLPFFGCPSGAAALA